MPKKLSKIEVLKRLENYIKKTGKVPTTRELSKVGLPCMSTYIRYFGSYNKALEAIGYDPNVRHYEKEELIKILHDYIKEKGKIPFMDDFAKDPSVPSSTTYINHFGNWTNALIEAGIRPNRITHEFDGLLKTYKNDKKGKLSPSTIRTYLSALQDLSNFLKSRNKTLKDLIADDVVDYFEYLKDFGSFSKYTLYTKPNSPNGLRAKARIINAFLTWTEKYSRRKRIDPPLIDLAEIEEIRDTLKSKQVVPPETETPRRALMQEEIEQIRSVIKCPIERNIFDLGLNLGLRVSEFEKITMDMVLGKPEERRPRLNGSEAIPRYEREHYIEVRGKGNKTRFVVLTEEMKNLIKKQLVLRKLHRVEHDRFFFGLGKMNKGHLQVWKVYEIYDKLSKKSEIKFRQHDLRYTMSELFQDKGVKQHIVKQRLGHAGDITQRYSRAKIKKRYELLQEKVALI